MPVKGGPNIRTNQAIVWLDAADKSSYPGTGTTWINSVTPGTYNGTLNNTSFNSTDALGALFFSGSNTFADMGNIGAISGSYTFQVAVKPLPTGSPYTILSYTSGSGTGSVTFRLDYSSSIQTAVFSAFASSGSVNKTYSLSTTIPTGSWSILQGSFNGTSLKFYRNGTLVNTTFTTGSITGYSDNNRFLVGGVSQFTGSYLSGSIGNVAVYSASLNTYFIATNYNGLATRFGLPTITTPQSDEDVSDFINTAGITDPTQIAAITALVADLKAYNLWDNMVAIYPFVGASATSHRYNLKQPSTYAINWFGGIDHTSLGVVTTATNAAGYTGLVPRTALPNISSSAHISANLNTNSSASTNIIIGNSDLPGAAASFRQAINIAQGYFGSTNIQYSAFTTNIQLNATRVGNGQGLWVAARVGDIIYGYRRSAVQNITLFNGPYTFDNSSFINNQVTLLQGTSYGGGPAGIIMNFATVGNALTETDVNNLYTVINTYNTTLSRL